MCKRLILVELEKKLKLVEHSSPSTQVAMTRRYLPLYMYEDCFLIATALDHPNIRCYVRQMLATSVVILTIGGLPKMDYPHGLFTG
jgi:hypothetical protein